MTVLKKEKMKKKRKIHINKFNKFTKLHILFREYFSVKNNSSITVHLINEIIFRYIFKNTWQNHDIKIKLYICIILSKYQSNKKKIKYAIKLFHI